VGNASMADAAAFLGLLVSVLWVALAVAIAVFVVAALSKVLGPVVHWIEARALPRVARRSRVHHGLPPDAPRWACRACHSVNEATAPACYRCGAPAPEVADALPEPSGGELFAPPRPASRFDPALYRGPGAPTAPPPDAGERQAAAPAGVPSAALGPAAGDPAPDPPTAGQVHR